MTDQGETAIRPLDDRTVERIAAGEVVERPASAVKELVENSIDADASTVDVAVDGDGTDLLRVSDDGHGMTEADVRAAVRAHTTSKIADIDDLERGVGTLGFRGEALHTIGAVSRTAIETKPRDATVAGTRLEYEGGTVVGVAPVGCPAGTTVTVRDLFYNTPARRKYLKQEATEFAHVSRVVSRYALANPDVAVSLTHDGRETFATSGEDDLQTAIMAVYGREVATAMVPVVGGEPPAVAADLDGLVPPAVEVGVDPDPAAPVEGIAGYVSHPETTRSSADYVSAFVDGRYVRSSTVRDAVVEAYDDQLASDRYPFTVLFLSTKPGSVDVNVHPRKTEVRFEDDATVRRSVRDAVRAALLDHGVVRSSAPRGRSAPDDTPVDPARAADEGGETPTGEERPTPAAHETGDAGRRGAGASGSDDTRRASGPTEASGGAGEGRGSRSRPAAAGSAESSRSHDGPTGTRAGGDAESEDGEPRRSNGDVAANDGDARQFEAPSEQRTLDGERAAPAHDGERLPSMRVLGQLADTYVVAETDDGLVLVDQHAADERVQYERLRRRLDDTGRQRLADPVDLSVTAAEAATVETAGDALERLGFEVDRLDAAADGDDDDRRRVRVTAVPAAVEAVDPELLRDVLTAVVGGADPAASVEAAADAVLADLACHPSVTGNTSLTEGRVTDLLSALDDCENPYACPHGRPTLVRIDREEIEGRFERDYPGHGGR